MIDTDKVGAAVTALKINEDSQIPWEDFALNELIFAAMIDFKPMSYSAKPYVEALMECTDMEIRYGAEVAGYLVPYFLNNATTWRGPVARRIKKELKKRYQEWTDGGWQSRTN